MCFTNKKPRISEKLQHSRQKGKLKPNARMIALHIIVTVRRILSIRPRYIRTGHAYSSAVYPFSFTGNPVPAVVKDTHAHRASIDSRLKLVGVYHRERKLSTCFSQKYNCFFILSFFNKRCGHFQPRLVIYSPIISGSQPVCEPYPLRSQDLLEVIRYPLI